MALQTWLLWNWNLPWILARKSPSIFPSVSLTRRLCHCWKPWRRSWPTTYHQRRRTRSSSSLAPTPACFHLSARILQHLPTGVVKQLLELQVWRNGLKLQCRCVTWLVFLWNAFHHLKPSTFAYSKFLLNHLFRSQSAALILIRLSVSSASKWCESPPWSATSARCISSKPRSSIVISPARGFSCVQTNSNSTNWHVSGGASLSTCAPGARSTFRARWPHTWERTSVPESLSAQNVIWDFAPKLHLGSMFMFRLNSF